MWKTARLALVGMGAALLLSEVIVRLFIPVRNVGPSFTVFDPVYGKAHRKNFSCERITPEFRMRFSTNALGHRGPDPPAFPEHGIVFLGDSFTEGLGVNDGEEFPDLIRRVLDQRFGPGAVPVVNAGIGNTGNGMWLKFLHREVHRYKPRLVVLQLMNNDFSENIQEQLFTLSETAELVEQAPLPPQTLRLVQHVVEAIPGLSYSYLFGLIREAYWMTVRPSQIPLDGKMRKTLDRLTYALVDSCVNFCLNRRIPLLILIVGFDPDRVGFMKNIIESHNNVPSIVFPSKAERPDLYYQTDGHWNVKGHEHAALAVLEAIERLHVLPHASPATSSEEAHSDLHNQSTLR